MFFLSFALKSDIRSWKRNDLMLGPDRQTPTYTAHEDTSTIDVAFIL